MTERQRTIERWGADFTTSVYSFPRPCGACGETFEPLWDEIMATITELNAQRDLGDDPATAEDAVQVIDQCRRCRYAALKPGQTMMEGALEYALEQVRERTA